MHMFQQSIDVHIDVDYVVGIEEGYFFQNQHFLLERMSGSDRGEVP